MAQQELKLLPRLIKGTLAHGLGGILSSAVNFVLLFIYSKYLLPDTYGILAILLIIQVFCEVFPSLGMNGSIMMLYYKKETDELRDKLVSTTIISTLALSFLFILLLVPVSSLLAQSIFGHAQNYTKLIILAGICGVLQNAINFPKVHFRMLEQDAKHAIWDIVQALTRLILVSFFLITLDMGLLGVLYGHLISLIVILVALYLPRLKFIRYGFSRADFLILISLGWPLIFAWVANWGLNSLDRLFLNHFIDLDTVGVYAFAFQLAMALRVLLVAPVEKIWPSMLFQTEDNEQMKERYKSIMSLFLMGSCAAVTALLLFADELYLHFFPHEYYPSRQYLSIAAIVPVLMGLNVLISSGARLKRKMTFFPKALFITVAVGFILNYIFVQFWGSMGIAVATLCTLIIMNLIYFLYSQNVHPIDFGAKSLVLATAYLGVLSLMHIYIFDISWLTNLEPTKVYGLLAVKVLALGAATFGFKKHLEGMNL